MTDAKQRDELLAQVEEKAVQAHALLSALLERRMPHSTTRTIIGASMLLREALALIERERVTHAENFPIVIRTPLDLPGFARRVLHDSTLSFRLRLDAQQALSTHLRPVTSPARDLFELAEFVGALRATLGCDLQDAAFRVAQSEEFKKFAPPKIERAVRLHEKAVDVLQERPI